MANKPRKKKYDYQAYPKEDGLRFGMQGLLALLQESGGC